MLRSPFHLFGSPTGSRGSSALAYARLLQRETLSFFIPRKYLHRSVILPIITSAFHSSIEWAARYQRNNFKPPAKSVLPCRQSSEISLEGPRPNTMYAKRIHAKAIEEVLSKCALHDFASKPAQKARKVSPSRIFPILRKSAKNKQWKSNR